MSTTVKDELLQRDVESYFRAEADIRAGLEELTPEDASRALIAFALAVKEAGVSLNDARFTELLREYGTTIRAQRRAAVPNGLGSGIVVRAGCRSGIIVELEEGAIGDMKPYLVRQLSDQVAAALQAAFDIPKA